MTYSRRSFGPALLSVTSVVGGLWLVWATVGFTDAQRAAGVLAMSLVPCGLIVLLCERMSRRPRERRT